MNDLAESLDLTDNAVRLHLTSLERDGLVKQAGTRPGVRKPHNAYALTPEAELLFPKAYAPVLKQLLDLLCERMTPRAMNELLGEVGRRLAVQQQSCKPDADLRERAGRGVHLLSALGGLAEIEENPESGELTIQGYSCPLSDVAGGHPEVCHMAEALLSDVIGEAVHEKCNRTGAPRCAFAIVRAGFDLEPART